VSLSRHIDHRVRRGQHASQRGKSIMKMRFTLRAAKEQRRNRQLGVPIQPDGQGLDGLIVADLDLGTLPGAAADPVSSHDRDYGWRF
jgi:hypothetical protein